jgi:RHS repeat-associated protein
LALSVIGPPTSFSVSSISGGGVTTWSKAVRFSTSACCDEEIWYGKVATAGASTITATWSASVASQPIEYSAQEFSASTGTGTTWAVDHTGTLNNTVSSTTTTYPSLSPSSTGELYFGYLTDNSATGGSTTGFTYDTTAVSNQVTFNPSVSSPSAYQPTGTQTPAGTSSALAALFTATGAGGSCTTGSSSGSGPIVNGVSPCTGSTAGGTSVVITGLNFTGATAVSFGSTPATSYSVTSSTSITAVAPAGTTGPVDVTVTTAPLALEELAAYSAYGVQTIQSGAKVTPFGFQGSYTDPSGLIYLIDRYYDPTTDQFLSVDPDLAETDQAYAFTGDDPLNKTDPLGLSGSGGYDASYLKATAKTKAYCKKHPNAKGHDCGGFLHELVGTLDKGRHFVAKHRTGELEIAGAVLTVGSAVATGGTSLVVEATAEEVAEETATEVIAQTASGGSKLANGLNVASTAASGVNCLTGSGRGAAVSCVAAGTGVIGTGLGFAASASQAADSITQLNNLYSLFNVAGLLPSYAIGINGS